MERLEMCYDDLIALTPVRSSSGIRWQFSVGRLALFLTLVAAACGLLSQSTRAVAPLAVVLLQFSAVGLAATGIGALLGGKQGAASVFVVAGGMSVVLIGSLLA